MITLRFSAKNPLDAPDAFTLDFISSGFLATGETISSGATVAVSPSSLTVASVTQTTTTITAWLSGGTSGTDYTIAYTFSTSSGRNDTRSAMLFVGPI